LSNQGPKTLFDKIWSEHLVGQREDGTNLLYIDRHLVHEVTSPQAFEGLKLSNRPVHRPEATIAVADHNVTTINRQNIIKWISNTVNNPCVREQFINNWTI